MNWQWKTRDARRETIAVRREKNKMNGEYYEIYIKYICKCSTDEVDDLMNGHMLLHRTSLQGEGKSLPHLRIIQAGVRLER